jgi:hypothetical protein
MPQPVCHEERPLNLLQQGAFKLRVINEKPGEKQKASAPEIEVRYSEKFLRERKREGRRTAGFGAFLMLGAGSAVLNDTLYAYRNHTWVNLAARINQQVLFPPVVGALLGLLFLGLSLYFIWQYFFRSK